MRIMEGDMRDPEPGQIREGQSDSLYLVLHEAANANAGACWWCAILVEDPEFPDRAGSIDDIPTKWLRRYTRVVE